MLASALAATLASVEQAEVHPHVFAEARLDVILSHGGTFPVRRATPVWPAEDGKASPQETRCTAGLHALGSL